MLLKELIRFSTQHRTLYCYLILSIWIFLLIAGLEYFGYAKGMYKYIGTNGGSLSLFSAPYASTALATTGLDKEEAQKYRKFKERCTPLEHLLNQHNDEGGILEGFQLQGVLLVIRHGDRGPLSHVRDIGGINCGVQSDVLVNKYRSFLHNSSSTSGSNHMYWYKTGPFHSFALLPATEKTCQLGQLTYKGIAQLLHVGDILHQIYAYPLGLLTKQPPSKSAMNSTPYSLLYSDEVVVYTTRYRRTFQSALALLYTLLPVDKWLALNIHESHSMAFCFSDCACPKAEALRKLIATKNARQLSQHSGIKSIMHWFGQTLLQHTPNGISDLNEVVDAMLAVVCHDARWPHRRSAADGSHALPSSTPEPSTADLSDVINIDQDDTAANVVEPNANAATAHHSGAGGLSNELPSGHSVGSLELGNESGDALALLSYANWQSMREVKSTHYKRMGLLRAYGMIRHIVSGMLRMISGDRTKIVLYSGHDWTLQFLTAALGIQTETTFIPYAARLSFELYKARSDYYFRVLYNGRDVTRQIDICEGGKSLRVTRDSRGNKADLCPIENIIRFLHEDYFAPLNATNFKDACFEPPKGKE